MLHALIIDDEPRGSQSLQKMIQHHCKDIEVLGIAHSGEDGIKMIAEFKPDLIFLDVQMPYMNGFEMLEKMSVIDFDVIFTTAYDNYALKAFRFSAIDYLLKPIDIDELQQAVEKVRQKQGNTKEGGYRNIEQLIHSIKSQTFNKVALPTSEGIIFLNIADIIRLEADSNYTRFFTIKRSQIIVSKTLGEYEEMLAESHFFRVHNRHLVNLRHIERYMKGDGGSVIMSDNSEVEVARRKKEEFLKRIEQMVK